MNLPDTMVLFHYIYLTQITLGHISTIPWRIGIQRVQFIHIIFIIQAVLEKFSNKMNLFMFTTRK